MTTANDDKQTENLVAYLDGELDEATANVVEQQLASDVEVRHQIDKLSRAWDLLDLLPSRKASQSFTERTLSAIHTGPIPVETEADRQGEQLPSHARIQSLGRTTKWGQRVLAFALLVVVAAAGFNNSYLTGSGQTQELLREYPVLKRVHEYRDAGSVEFLKELQKQKVFDGKQPRPREPQ